MPATLEERYNTHVEARKVFDAAVEAIDEEYLSLHDSISDELTNARDRRDQLTNARNAAVKEARGVYKEVTGVEVDGPF